jgi:hypothetical protein
MDEGNHNNNLHALCGLCGLQSCRHIVLVDMLLIDVHPRKCIINLVEKARGRSMLAYSVSVRVAIMITSVMSQPQLWNFNLLPQGLVLATF